MALSRISKAAAKTSLHRTANLNRGYLGATSDNEAIAQSSPIQLKYPDA